MEHKVPYPDECRSVLKELKKGKVLQGDLNEKFKDKHIDIDLECLAKAGLTKRTFRRFGNHGMIELEYTGAKATFKQGRRNFPGRKGGLII